MNFKILLVIASVITISLCEYIPPGPKYKCPKRSDAIFPCKCTKESDAGISVRCENTNLASLSVGFNNLVQYNTPIEDLTISKCHMGMFFNSAMGAAGKDSPNQFLNVDESNEASEIEAAQSLTLRNVELTASSCSVTNVYRKGRLYGKLFYKTKCRVLIIEDTPIKGIDEHTFYGINETLQELHVVNTMLRDFPKMALKALGHLTVLRIDQHNISTLDADIFVESGASEKLEKIHLTNGNISDLPIEAFQVLRKLKTLDLHGNKIGQLKKNQFKNLRDLEILDISFNNITKMDSSHISDLTKLGFCNVSHNNLAELTRGTFARSSVLKVLHMGHNKIKRLDSNSFRGMRFLRRLFLNDNNITDIGRGTFGSVTRIGTIDLARNSLKKIDYQMFAQLNYVEVIDVSENQIQEIQKQSFKDLYLTVINISRNAISKIESNSFENCANITLLDLSHNLIEDIPKETFDSTTYANELQLSYNFLKDLAQVPLHNMTGLKILNVSNNALTAISKNTFPKLYELHTIDLSHNNISVISNAVFQTLFSLRSLNLSYNSLENIKPPIFGTLPTLLEMDLSNNQLKEIARGALTKLASLRFLTLDNNYLERIFQIPISLNHLTMRNNRISEIPDKTWPSMNALLSLDVAENQLNDTLFSGSFQGLLTLQKLNLNSNGITKIPWESLTPLSTLQYLYLENNNVTELPKSAFGKLPVVFEVNLHNNQLSTISSHAFEGLLQLLTLNLSSNSLKSIPTDAFFGLVSMRTIDLSFNLLEKLDNKTNGMFDDCLSLEKINLSHNKVSFITRKSFSSSPYIPYRLADIDLSYNAIPVLTYDITFGTKKVKKLNISHNSINDIRRGVLGNLTSLEDLDISHNDLHDLTTEANIFNLPENITNLRLSHNSLQKLPVKNIVKMKNLLLLDVRNNDLESIDYEIIKRIEQGLLLYVEDNPITCDCHLRPLNHFFSTMSYIPEIFSNIICHSPKHIQDIKLIDVPDDHLNCVNNSDSSAFLDVLPDLKFRDIHYTRGKLYIQWYVTSPNKDIADFYIIVRNKDNSILFEKFLAYDERSFEILEEQLPKNFKDHIEVCVLAKNSDGVIRSWFNSQCFDLTTNFESVVRKFNENYNYEYSIVSPKKKISGRSKDEFVSSKAHAMDAVISIKFIAFCYLLSILRKKIFENFC